MRIVVVLPARLAGAVGAEEADDLAFRYGKGEVVDDGLRAVALGDRFESNHGG
jgi:hypothetical protein